MPEMGELDRSVVEWGDNQPSLRVLARALSRRPEDGR
jgi:hypothetical protein